MTALAAPTRRSDRGPAARRGRRRWVCALAAVALQLGGCRSVARPPEPDAAAQGLALRVAAYNVRHGAGLDGVVDG